MVKIKDVKLGVIPRVVLSIDDATPISFVKRAKEKGVDILEVRIDRFKKINKEYISQKVSMFKKSKMPIIATIRSRKEGGGRDIVESERLRLFEHVLPLIDAVDIELYSRILNEVLYHAHRDRKVGIVSFHNFKDTPTDRGLEEIIANAKDKKADIVKIATFARRPSDLLRLMGITLKHRDKNLITISLGNNSAISRVIFPFFGSLLTYTYINAPSGPGQLPLNVLLNELKLYYPKFNKSYG